MSPHENGEVAKCAHYHWGSSYFVDNGTTEGYRGAVDTVEVITGRKIQRLSDPRDRFRTVPLHRQL